MEFRLECNEKFLLLKVSLSLSYQWKLYDPSPKLLKQTGSYHRGI